MAGPWEDFLSGDTATATAPADEQGPWTTFQPEEPAPVQAPDLSKIKLSPYDQATEDRGGLKPHNTGMESGTELTAAVGEAMGRDPIGTLFTPLVKIPRIEGRTALGKLAAAPVNVAAGVVQGIESPGGLLTLPFGGPAVRGVFAGLAAKGAGEQLGEASVTGDVQQAAEGLLGAGLAPAIALHGTLPARTGPIQVPPATGEVLRRPPGAVPSPETQAIEAVRANAPEADILPPTGELNARDKAAAEDAFKTLAAQRGQPPAAPTKAEAPAVAPEVTSFIEELRQPEIKPGGTNRATDAGLKATSIAELDALAAEHPRIQAEIKRAMAEGKMDQAMMLGGRVQLPRESIEAAANVGSNDVEMDAKMHGGTPKYPTERPLDWRTHPEVADWLRANGSKLGIALPDELKAPKPAAAPPAPTAALIVPRGTEPAPPASSVGLSSPVDVTQPIKPKRAYSGIAYRDASAQFKQLVLENGIEHGWIKNPDFINPGATGYAAISHNTEMTRAYKLALKELGISVDRNTPKIHADALPKLKSFLEKHASMVPVPMAQIPDKSTFTRLGEEHTVKGTNSKTGMVTIEDGIPIKVHMDDSVKIDPGSLKTPETPKLDLTLDQPESVDQQKARLEAEQAAALKKSQGAQVQAGAAKPLVGAMGDIGQGDMLGGNDLFSAAPENRMPAGPGAQTAGTDTPEGSQLAQLSRAVRLQSISPKEPFANRLRAALDLAGKWGRGKDAATSAVGRLVAAKDALWDRYTHLPAWDNFTASIGRWIGADQRTAMEVRDFQKAITKTVPNKLRREAITNWIQANGDEGVLGSRMQASKGSVRRGYQTALNLNDAEKTLARNIGSYFESRLQEGIDQGILKQGVDAYVNQIWKRPTPSTQKLWADLFGGGTLNPNFKFAKQRIFESYFEGEQAGFIPKNKDIGHLIATYDMAFNRALSARAMIRELHTGKAKDGMPIVMTSGQGVPLPKGETPPEAILVKSNYAPKGAVTADGRPYRTVDHWALRDWKWVAKTGDTAVFVQGNMLVHPDHWTHLNNVLKTSRLRQNPVSSFLLATGSFAKQTKLSLSPFHTVQEGVHSMAHRVNPVNPSALDMADPVQKSLLDHGLMVADPRGYDLFTEGMSGGGLVGKIPGLGALQQWYTEMTFKDYIPRLKMAMARDALERNRAAYAKKIASGRITDDQIVALTARESNAAFGEQNYRMMGRSATTQDFLRLSLLAPDFLEARARFVLQALKPYGREQRIALALMGATLYTGARILNKTLDDDYHWSPKHAFSVFQNGKEYRLRTVLGDVQHLLTDNRSFWYNRLSPITRTAAEYLFSRDDRGIKRSTMEQFADFLSWFKPIPLQIRPGESAGQAVLASAGVPARTYGKQQQLYEVLDNWRSKQTDPAIKEAYDRQRQETHVTSIYGPLRMALNADNMKQAQAEYQKLLSLRAPDKIRTALTPNRPFTGSNATEKKFRDALSPQEQKLYDEALAERVRMLNRFEQLRSPSAAPAAAQPPWEQFR